MVLAVGCGDSNGGDGRPNPVDRVIVTGTPENPSFQGFAPDLTGVTITAFYRDGTSRNVSLNEVLIEPEFVYGTIHSTLGPGGSPVWTPRDSVVVRYGGVAAETTVTLPTVYGITRVGFAVGGVTGTPDLLDGEFFANQPFFSGGEFWVHGAGQMRLERYVDEYPINFDRLVAEVFFDDGGAPKRFYLSDMPQGSIQGVIVPHYDRGPTTSGSGTLFVTFGRHPSFNPGNDLDGEGNFIVGVRENGTFILRNQEDSFSPIVYPQLPDPGVTVALRLPTVHHVTNLEFVSAPELPGVFYWEQPNDWTLPNFTRTVTTALPAATPLTLPPEFSNVASPPVTSANWWRARARTADATFRVHYSNGSSRVADIRDLEQRPEVWRNDNVSGLTEQRGNQAGTVESRPFRVAGVFNPWHDMDPVVTFYYRGWTAELPVRVYTTLNSVEVLSDWEGVRTINLAQVGRWDNDRWIEGDEAVSTAEDFANLLTVTATWSTNRGESTTIPLAFRPNFAEAHGAIVGSREDFPGQPILDDDLPLPADFDIDATDANQTEATALLLPAAADAWRQAFGSPLGVNHPGRLPLADMGRTFSMDFGVADTRRNPAGDWLYVEGWGQVNEIFVDATDQDTLMGDVTRIRIWYYSPRSVWEAHRLLERRALEGITGDTPYLVSRDFSGSVTNTGGGSRTAESGQVRFVWEP